MSAAIKTIVFTDIDDTLIHTGRKLAGRESAEVGALDKQGEPLSFFTQPQRQLLELLVKSGAMIRPVTGRNKDALGRVLVDFQHYKVVSHGAVVLSEDDQLCPYWLKEIDAELAHWPEQLEQANQSINQAIETMKLDASSKVIVDQEIPAYVSVKGKLEDLEHLKAVTHADTAAFFRHENGHNHALLPPYTRKKRAMNHVMNRLGISEADLTIGVGDSVSDLPFMNACHFSLMPSDSQIVREHLSYED